MPSSFCYVINDVNYHILYNIHNTHVQKIKDKGHLVQKMEWKQTEAIVVPPVLAWSVIMLCEAHFFQLQIDDEMILWKFSNLYID